MNDDEFTQTWVKRLVERSGRRSSDQIIGWVRLLREVVLVLALIWLAATGGDISSLLG